jgi:acetyltransferase-like isoleucine patch superfamily enzyme
MLSKIKEYLKINNLRINFYFLPWRQAIKLPILVKGNLKIVNRSGKFELKNPRYGKIRFGVFDSIQSSVNNLKTVIDISGVLTFDGRANFGVGCHIQIDDNANLKIGNNFHNTGLLSLHVKTSCSIGDNAMLAWNVLIIDHDYHKILNLETDKITNKPAPIYIGKNNWFCANTIILKGITTESNIVCGINSIVNKHLLDANCVYSGNPIRVVKRNIYWQV